MNKLLLIFALLISTTLSAHNPFHSDFFHHGFNDGFWRDFDRQFQQIDRQINQLKKSGNSFSTQSRQYFDEKNNNYVVQIVIDGLTKDNIDISTTNNMITIKGSHKIEKQSTSGTSRSSRSFTQSFSLPRDADQDNIDASFDNNILTISIPKLDQPKPLVQKITIK